MLGKLLKYDMKRQMKLLFAAYLVVGLVAGFSAIFRLVFRNFEDTTGVVGIVRTLVTGLAIVAVAVMVVGTFIYAVLYFRKNLFKDEGYLMHTLPVKSWQLYMSKVISSTLCSFLSILVAVAAICLAFLHIPDVADIMSGAMAVGIPKWFFIVTIIVFCIAIPANLVQFYVSLVFGYTIQTNTKTPVNKDLMSVISYIVIYMVQQVAMIGVMLVWVAMNIGKITDSKLMNAAMAGTQAPEELLQMMWGLYAISIVLMVLLSVVLSVLSVLRMEKRLNLS